MYTHVLLFALLVLISGCALLILVSFLGAFAPVAKAQSCRVPVVILKAAIWAWLLGLIYIGLNPPA